MKNRLLAFIDALRVAGLRVSVSETLDAMEAVAQVGVDRTIFREALTTTLVKDEADRPVFDDIFERFFARPSRSKQKQRRGRPEAPVGASGRGAGTPEGASRSPEREPPRGQRPARLSPDDRLHSGQTPFGRTAEQLMRRRALRLMPFSKMSPRDVEECAALVADLARRFTAHLRRRLETASRSRIDIRRTIRRSLGTGGVPIRPAWRRRTPSRPDLVVLCDFSHSVSTASRFMCSLIAPAAAFFRRVRLFAYVDRPVELSHENGHLIPHGPLDLYSRSDFGRTLKTVWDQRHSLLTRNTIVLILGDARNNWRPPRHDLLQRVGHHTRHIIWLNPDAPQRWNTGDSVIAAYEPHCDVVLSAPSLGALTAALRLAFRRSH